MVEAKDALVHINHYCALCLPRGATQVGFRGQPCGGVAGWCERAGVKAVRQLRLALQSCSPHRASAGGCAAPGVE